MDKREARQILGVAYDAGINDIEKRYAVLLKKYRIEKNQRIAAINEAMENDAAISAAQANADDPTIAMDIVVETGAGGKPVNDQEVEVGEKKVAPDVVQADDSQTEQPDDAANDAIEDKDPTDEEFERITEAYNVLMGYDTKPAEEEPSKAAPLLKKAGIDEKKAKNFFYYYKFHILIAILLLATIVYSVKGCMNRVEPDFNAAFVGRIGYFESTEVLGKSIKSNIPIITEPGFDGAYIDENTVGDQLYAMEMKLTVLFGAADIDVFILDSEHYQRFAKQGVFMDLDEIAPRLGADVASNQEQVVAIENYDVFDDIEGTQNNAITTEEPHLYGIDVSNSTVLKEAGVIADDMIAAIFLGTERQEKAKAFLKLLLN